MALNQQLKDGHTTVKPSRVSNSRSVQNFILVWLDPYINEMNENNFHNSIGELQRIVNTVITFIDANQCIDFIFDIKEEKILIIIPDELAVNFVPMVHSITQINSFYIFCKNESKDKQWIKQWPKVKNKFISISSICQTIKQDVRTFDQDSMPISFVSASTSGDQLDPTFMYTQILKEILLTIRFNEQHIKEFTNYYRENFGDNIVQLNNIDEFERTYNNNLSIWWYTHDCCLYSILNRALRMMEVDTIIKIGFLIRDLHHQIEQLHSEQSNMFSQSDKFTIYRGQGLSKTDFKRMQQTQGGLISFNNFLSTSRDLSVALTFARSSIENFDSVGIIFVMTIDPSIKSSPFACINDVSYYKTEDEILFSMHTVFRIDSIIPNIDDNRLWQVDLIQTSDNDPQLNDLTIRIRNDIQGSTEWDRLGKLLIKLAQFNKAEQLYKVLLDQTYNERQKIHLYHQIGWTKKKQKQYEEAIPFYEKALQIKQINPNPNYHSLAVSFNELGSVYEKMNAYSQALLYYEKGLQIEQKLLSSDQSGLASSYSKIASIYEKLGEYDKALSFHQNAVQIRQKILPVNNVILAYYYNNIGSVYEKMKDYLKAASSYERAFQIQQNTLPSNHPDLAESCSRIAFLYSKMDQYDKARQFHQRAVDIGHRSLPSNHPDLQRWKKNLEYIKKKSN